MVLLRAFWYAFDRNFLKRVYDVLALPLNDYYAATRLDPSRPDEAARMSSIFDLYAKQGIKCVYFTVPVSFDETVSLHAEPNLPSVSAASTSERHPFLSCPRSRSPIKRSHSRDFID